MYFARFALSLSKLEDTHARENSNKICFSPHLIVSLQHKTIITYGNIIRIQVQEVWIYRKG